MSKLTALPDIARPAGYTARIERRIKDAEAKTPGLRVKNLASTAGGSVTELYIYDYIDPWADEFWGGISAQMVVTALADIQTDEIRVRINSPGGDVFDGIAIMNALLSQNANVTVVVDALCASIATVIAMAGQTITMSPGSQMMIHPASGFCMGDATDMRKLADILDFQTKNIAGLYAARAGGKVDTWLAAMNAETWLSADEAVKLKLADTVGVVKQASDTGQAVPVAPASTDDEMWDLTVFHFAGRAKAPTPAVAATCVCGPGAWSMVDKDHQHLTNCPRLGNLVPRLANYPAPIGVLWNVVSASGTPPCEAICEPLIAGNPYEENNLPSVGDGGADTHPNCGCSLEVQYGSDMGNRLTKTPSQPAPVNYADVFRNAFEGVKA